MPLSKIQQDTPPEKRGIPYADWQRQHGAKWDPTECHQWFMARRAAMEQAERDREMRRQQRKAGRA